MATTLETSIDAMTAKPTQVVPPININPTGDPLSDIGPGQSEVPPSIDSFSVTEDAEENAIASELVSRLNNSTPGTYKQIL